MHSLSSDVYFADDANRVKLQFSITRSDYINASFIHVGSFVGVNGNHLSCSVACCQSFSYSDSVHGSFVPCTHT